MNNSHALKDEHAVVFDELCWYVNETLEDNMHARVDSHLKTCAVCREEVNMLKRTFEGVTTPAVPSDHVEQALARTMARIDQHEREAGEAGVETSAAKENNRGLVAAWLAKLRGIGLSALKRITPFGGTGSNGPVWAVAACLMLAVVLTLFQFQAQPDGQYRVLTSDDPAQSSLSVRVVFKHDVTPAHVLALVRNTGVAANVSQSGPTGFLIELAPDSAFNKIDLVFSTLQAHPSVDSVEAVLAPAN